MILTKELGLTVSKQKGKKKKKKKNGRNSKTYSSVPVALGGRITHNAAFGGAECRYRYVNHPQIICKEAAMAMAMAMAITLIGSMQWMNCIWRDGMSLME